MTVPASGDFQIDPRGPRFGAAITTALAALAILLGATTGGVIVAAVLVALFIPGAIVGPQATLQGAIFKSVVRPRLATPKSTESFRPPRFAQQVGLVFSLAALLFGLLGVSVGFFVFAGFLFVASFLNAAIGFCLGCEIYLIFKRLTARAA